VTAINVKYGALRMTMKRGGLRDIEILFQLFSADDIPN